VGGDFLFREADLSEVEALAGLINRAFEVERFFLDGDRTDPEKVRELFAKGHFLVAKKSSGLAGCVYIEKRENRAYLGLLSIEPQFQRAGLGLRLTAMAEDFARSLGCEAMDLRIVNVREELPAFYHRAGYVETGTEPFPPDASPRVPCHFIVMSKALR
jgi:GNAT superfamily N-acetyltransferase